MSPARGLVVVTALLLAATGQAAVQPASGSPAAPGSGTAAVHDISVSGSSASIFPAFDQGIARYGLRAGEGTVLLEATTSDPDGLVRVNGRPVPAGEAVELPPVDEGDETSVLITDSEGTTAYSLIHLPLSFPDVDVVVNEPGRAPGHVFLTLTNFFGGDRFEAVVDEHGVPVHVRRVVNGMDLKLQPNGSYSVARADNTALVTPYDVVELDARFEEVAAYRTVGLQNTDFHDSILLPDGSRYLMAYEENAESGDIDSIVQHIGQDGALLFEWNSKDHIDPELDGLTPLRDYAHLNSLDLMADGDLLLSFRHTSQLLKVARTAHDGWAVGDVVWRLGGRRSDFTFPDDPYAGPCAQHTARELPNGNILVFDNGSEVTPTTLEPMCPDPAAPAGDRVERPQSRFVEYDVDEDAGTARMAWSWERPGLFAEFAGSAQRLPGGNILGGFASASPDVIEVDPGGDVVWELDLPDAFSYRALKFPAPDAIEPVVELAVPAGGAEYLEGADVRADFGCTDRGGAGLAGCEAPSLPGAQVDTSTVGEHVFEVLATDGAGNATVVTRSYVVLPRWRPDAMLRKHRDGAWRGDDRYAPGDRQTVRVTVHRPGGRRTVWFRVQNDGVRAERLRLTGSAGSRAFAVTWRADGEVVTRRLADGRLRTPRLEPGQSYRLRAVVQRLAGAEPGRTRAVELTAASVHRPGRRDTVRARFSAG